MSISSGLHYYVSEHLKRLFNLILVYLLVELVIIKNLIGSYQISYSTYKRRNYHIQNVAFLYYILSAFHILLNIKFLKTKWLILIYFLITLFRDCLQIKGKFAILLVKNYVVKNKRQRCYYQFCKCIA